MDRGQPMELLVVVLEIKELRPFMLKVQRCESGQILAYLALGVLPSGHWRVGFGHGH